jgi:hypothetical protein
MRKTISRFPTSLALAAGLGALASAAQADVPVRLTEQGRLFRSNDQPVTGTVTLTFAIYASASGGTALWSESFEVTLSNGYYSAQLGATTPFPASLWSGGTKYLGLAVGTDEEMTPREELTSVPYALVASEVAGDIHPSSVSIGNSQVIDSSGNWVGPAISGGSVGKVASAISADSCTAVTGNVAASQISGSVASCDMCSVASSASSSFTLEGSKVTGTVASCDSCTTVTGSVPASRISGSVASCDSCSTASSPSPGFTLDASKVSGTSSSLGCTGCVQGTNIAGGSITNSKIAAGAVAASNIAPGTLGLTVTTYYGGAGHNLVPVDIPPGGVGWASGSCLSGEVAIGGDCQGQSVDASDNGLVVKTAAVSSTDPLTWLCMFKNLGNVVLTGVAWPRCLKTSIP